MRDHVINFKKMQEILLKLTPMKTNMESSQQRIRWKAVVMVTDGAGEVGFGQKIKRTQNLAVMAATGKAYRQRFHIALGSWDLMNIQTIPFYVIGRSGSGIKVHLKPAPEVKGLDGSTAGTGCPAIFKKKCLR